MKTISELNLGFSDAQNYMNGDENKKMFAEVFVKNRFLDKLMKPHTYYLIGEKGTGKTAYAVYLNNNEYQNTKSMLKYIAETDYEKFHLLKKKEHLDISSYVDIWQTIILLLFAKSIADNDTVCDFGILKKSRLKKILNAIDKYYNNAFSPEIVSALKLVEGSAVAAKLVSEYAEVSADKNNTAEFDTQKLQLNLYYICKSFADSFKQLKLQKNITIFIDGIDVRPNQISYEEYLECIKGLAQACWSLNTNLFSNLKSEGGKLKVVLLLRPDIFCSLNLQNSTNKLNDNSVFLDWRTTYKEYSTSPLYRMANKLLAYDQSEVVPDIWEKYFDWNIPEIRSSSYTNSRNRTAFIEFLKISLCRPRDINRILEILQNLMIDKKMGGKTKFSYSVYQSDIFQNQYSEYFLGSLKDQLSFYYSEEDYSDFKKFFKFFNSPNFSYDDYEKAHSKYIEYLHNNNSNVPPFAESPKDFLQLLYDSNVIFAVENTEYGRPFYHFSYKEKRIDNMAPEVPYGDDISYRFHFGMYKKSRLGRYR